MATKRAGRPDLELAARLGWKQDGTSGSGHLRLVHPCGRKMFLPATPRGGRRSLDNSLALIKRLTAQLGIDSNP